jgi:CRP-like cAMP-binding protein
MVVNGSVACIEGPDPSLIGVDLGPGTLLGELAMLIETHYGSTVVARTPVTAMRFARSAMHDLMLKDRGLAEHFASKIRARLSDIAHRLRAVEEAMQASDRMMPRRQMAG